MTALPIPYGEPSVLTAGNSYTFTRIFADFPIADGWVLSFVWAGEDVIRSASSWFTDDGNTYTVTIPTSAFDGKKPGVYRLYAVLTNTSTSERRTIDLGTVTLYANPSDMKAGEEALSFAERMVRKLEAQLLVNAGTDISSYSVAGRSVTRTEKVNLEKQLVKWQHKVWQEKHPGQLAPAVEARFPGVQLRTDPFFT